MKRIESALQREVVADYTRGVRLLGLRAVAGGGPRMDALFLAGEGALPGEAQYGVHAKMVGRSNFTWVKPDTLVRDLSQPMVMPANLWRRGFVYACPLMLYHRTGIETYETVFWSRDGTAAPERLGGANALDILTLK
jgi:hypothetical protein